MALDYSDFTQVITRSDTHRFRFTVKDKLTLLPIDITSFPQFWVTSKKNLFDADADAVFQLTLGHGITLITPSAGLAEVAIAPANTSSLDFRKYNLFTDIQMKDTSGGIWTLARGIVQVIADVTRSTS